MSSSTLQRSLAACAHAHYMEGITSIQRGLLQRCKVCNNLLRRSHKSNVCCELSIKRSMKKKDNSEINKLRKTFAVFHLVSLFIGRGAHWLTSIRLAAG